MYDSFAIVELEADSAHSMNSKTHKRFHTTRQHVEKGLFSASNIFPERM